MLKKVGIECESIEGKNPMWGVGRIIMKLLEEISLRPELEKEFRFVLYFKDYIPDFTFLNNPIFIKKRTPVPFFRERLFPIYYFALLPLRLWFENLKLMFWPNYMLPIIAWGSKNLVTLTEDVYHETHSGRLPFRYRLAYGIFGWWTAKFATKILAISNSSKSEVARLYKIDPARITVDHLGIDIKPDSGENYNLNIHNYLLYVGQAFPRRHLKETLEAFALIAKDYPDLKLIAIGPDKYESPIIVDLKDEVNSQLGREAIIHKDYVDESELTSLYKEARALIYVSSQEAFGLPPIEALALGTPAIVADTPVTHELFGENAFFVSEPSPENITQAMREVLTNQEKVNSIKLNGPLIARRYTWGAFTERFLETIRKIDHE